MNHQHQIIIFQNNDNKISDFISRERYGTYHMFFCLNRTYHLCPCSDMRFVSLQGNFGRIGLPIQKKVAAVSPAYRSPLGLRPCLLYLVGSLRASKTFRRCWDRIAYLQFNFFLTQASCSCTDLSLTQPQVGLRALGRIKEPIFRAQHLACSP